MFRIASAVLIIFVTCEVTGCASFPVKQDAPALLVWAAGGNHNENVNEKTDEHQAGHERSTGEAEPKTPAAETPIKTDRPTFTPSSSTVGKNHLQLEMGYTFTHDRLN